MEKQLAVKGPTPLYKYKWHSLPVPENSKLVPVTADASVHLSSAALRLYRVIVAHPYQRRSLRLSQTLSRIAEFKAIELAEKVMISNNTLNGESPNQTARAWGLHPAKWYPCVGNSYETVGIGFLSPTEFLDSLQPNTKEYMHVFGTVGFFEAQQAIGVGWSGSVYHTFCWVIWTCPEEFIK